MTPMSRFFAQRPCPGRLPRWANCLEVFEVITGSYRPKGFGTGRALSFGMTNTNEHTMRHFTVTIRATATAPTRIATPAGSEAEALADAIEALDPWGDRELDALRSAFSADYVDFSAYESEV